MEVTAREIRKLWAQQKPDASGRLPDLRIGISATYTAEPIEPYLGVNLILSDNILADIKFADYGQLIQTCLDPKSQFDNHLPDVIILFWRMEDLVSDTDSQNEMETKLGLFTSSLGNLVSNFKGMVIVAEPFLQTNSFTREINFSKPHRMSTLWHKVLFEIHSLSAKNENLRSFANSQVISEAIRVFDNTKQLLYRQPYTENFYRWQASGISRIVIARKKEPKKCVVVDCDNTIWGGIVGEDGLSGIQISQDMPGLAFSRFQQQLVELSKSGVFVALCSKNNPDDVWEVFNSHDGMKLKEENITTARINWTAKSKNILSIANELNISTDSIVFIDDNPFELSEVETHLPEVTCLLVPPEIEQLPELLISHAKLFDRLDITGDDVERVNRFKHEAQRAELKQNLTSEEFLNELGITVNVYEPQEADYARTTQLINKTNQFNCTTKRFSFDEVVEYSKGNSSRIYCMSVSDKFGDYGLVGVCMVHFIDDIATIDNFLMSCRVLGRGAENSFMFAVSKLLGKHNIETIKGNYIPSAKNKMVSDLFERLGFNKVSENSSGQSSWILSNNKQLNSPVNVSVNF